MFVNWEFYFSRFFCSAFFALFFVGRLGLGVVGCFCLFFIDLLKKLFINFLRRFRYFVSVGFVVVIKINSFWFVGDESLVGEKCI